MDLASDSFSNKLPEKLPKFLSYDEFIQNSDNFNDNICKFPCTTNRIKELKKLIKTPDFEKVVERQIQETTVLVSKVVYEKLLSKFINYIIENTNNDTLRGIYQGFLNQNDDPRDLLIKRLLEKRPIVFFNSNDICLFRGNSKSQSCITKGYEMVVFDEKYNYLDVNEYITYDEMEISALINVAVPTFFIDDGRRNKKNQGMEHEQECILVSLIGCRFENRYMETKYITVNRESNNNYIGNVLMGKKLSSYLRMMSEFYNSINDKIDSINSYEKIINNYQSEYAKRYIRYTLDSLFDVYIFNERIRLTLEPFFTYADNTGRTRGVKVYICLVGIGLGAWKKIDYQSVAMLNVIEDIFEMNKYNNIYIVDLSYYYGLDTKLELVNEKYNIITSKFEKAESIASRERKIKASNLGITTSKPSEKSILITSYAWDSNSFPGNEYWLKDFSSSDDPVTAFSSTIQEMQNPYINTVFTSNISVL